MRRFVEITVVLVPAALAVALLARGAAEIASAIRFAPSTAALAPTVTSSAEEPAPPRPPIIAASSEPRAAPAKPIERCPIASRTVAIVTDADDPRGSLAVLTWPGATGFSRPLVRPGGVVAGRRVLAITSTRVFLADRSGVCFIDDSETAPPKQPVVTTARAVEATDGHARVDRSVRDALVDKAGVAFRDVRVVPDLRSGKVVGMKIVSVAETSILAQLGLRAGDSLISINGFDLTTPEGALEAYARLRAAPSLEVSLRRDGAPKTLRVDVI